MDSCENIFWKDECIYFNDVSLETLAEELTGWFNVSVCFHEEKIKSKRVTGNIPDNLDLNEIVEILGAARIFSAEYKNGVVPFLQITEFLFLKYIVNPCISVGICYLLGILLLGHILYLIMITMVKNDSLHTKRLLSRGHIRLFFVFLFVVYSGGSYLMGQTQKKYSI